MFRRRAAASAAAFSCMLVGVVGAVSAPAAAAKSPRANAPVIVAPRQGDVVDGDLARIAVRAGMGADALSARLNGHAIAGQFGPDRDGVRSLDASVSDGLRDGPNVLEVTVRPRLARVRHATVRFRVRAGEPLVGAGLNRRVVVGEPVLLAGRVAAAGAGAGAARTRWSLVRRPALAAASSGQLVDPDGYDARFTPHAPGEYVLKLTDGSGGGAVSDQVTLDVVPGTPLVSVDTVVGTPGHAGIKVGTTTYPAATGDGGWVDFLQVLVLNRQTLAFVSNTNYTNTNDMAAALAQLGSDDLVIVSLQDPGGAHTQALLGEPLDLALASIGYPAIDPLQSGQIKGGDLSVIGVPGMNPGDAATHVDPGGGAMQGYLTPDQHLNYGFVAPDQVKVTAGTVAPSCAGSPGCEGGGGYLVSERSALTGEVVASQQFITDPVNSSEYDADQQAGDMDRYLAGVPNGDLIEIQTLGLQPTATGVAPAPIGTAVTRGTMDSLASAVASVGGTRNGFNREALKQGPVGGAPVYSLIGWTGAGAGHGVEAAAGVGGADDSPDLEVLLRRDHDYQMRPAQSRQNGPLLDGLQQLALQAPGSQPWPLSGDAGATAALDYLGNRAPRLGCDPRTSYWTQTLTEADTNTIRQTIAGAAFPGAQALDPCTGRPVQFTAAQFTAAQSELLTELKWVGNVRSYLAKLGTPFSSGALSSWSDAETIADQIYQDAASPDGQIALRWTSFTQTILAMVGPLTGGATTVMAGIMNLGTWIAGAAGDGTPGLDEVRIQADQLGKQLVSQAQDSQATLDRIGDIIVSDYAKLSTLGPVAGCAYSPTEPRGTCPEEYSWSDADKVNASTLLEQAVERISYQTLLPLGYDVYQLNPYPDNRDGYLPEYYGWPINSGAAPPAITRYRTNLAIRPWNSSPAWPTQAIVDQLWIVDPQDATHDQWHVLVLAVPLGDDVHGTPPPDALLSTMFNSLTKSGLGMSPTAYMSAATKHGYDEDDMPGQDFSIFWETP